MVKKNGSPFRIKNRIFHSSILIFAASMILTIMLWDANFNRSEPLAQEITSLLIFIMGTLFSISASLFSWSIETRRRQLEREVAHRTEQLNKTNQELSQKNQEIESFMHTISHDLKAPIVSIQGYASILRTELDGGLQSRHLEYFNRIMVNVKQMNMLIMDLLEFSRVGRIEDPKEIIGSRKLVDDIILELKPEIQKTNISINVRNNLPDLYGSRKRLAQVLTNLVGNAIKYMGSQNNPVIEIGSDMRSDGMCSIYIRDNGIGINKQYHEKIFQIFQRAPNSLKVEGTGVGLTVVKKIVELNGGKVSLDSTEGKGSTFYFTWPLAEKNIETAGNKKPLPV